MLMYRAENLEVLSASWGADRHLTPQIADGMMRGLVTGWPYSPDSQSTPPLVMPELGFVFIGNLGVTAYEGLPWVGYRLTIEPWNDFEPQGGRYLYITAYSTPANIVTPLRAHSVQIMIKKSFTGCSFVAPLIQSSGAINTILDNVLYNDGSGLSPRNGVTVSNADDLDIQCYLEPMVYPRRWTMSFFEDIERRYSFPTRLIKQKGGK
jgi:hypothetical protein